MAVDLLESLPRPIDDHAPQMYPVHYTSDIEHTYAHVALPTSATDDAARLIFQWDELDGWKYHDTKLMPFPQGSKASLEQVLASTPAHATSAPRTEAVPEYNPYGFSDNSDESDDDDYWNAYGAGDSDDPSPQNQLSLAKDAAGDSEDAYWARYATVQGVSAT